MSRKHSTAPLPRYLPALLRELADRQLAPGCYEVRVWHDPWCAIFQGRSSCNCNPEVELPLALSRS